MAIHLSEVSGRSERQWPFWLTTRGHSSIEGERVSIPGNIPPGDLATMLHTWHNHVPEKFNDDADPARD